MVFQPNYKPTDIMLPNSTLRDKSPKNVAQAFLFFISTTRHHHISHNQAKYSVTTGFHNLFDTINFFADNARKSFCETCKFYRTQFSRKLSPVKFARFTE